MKTLLSLVMAFTMISVTAQTENNKSFYDFTVKAIDGSNFDLTQLKGKKVLLVNTASECGYTPQYADLQDLYEQFGGDGFEIIGFPANNFMSQEPGTDEEIASFCKVNFGITFPLMSKISVKGKDMHPLYEWLTTKELNGVKSSKVKWNFQKYLIDEEGNLVDVIPPGTNPMDEEIINWINR